ncbi:E3 ubiquitin-protein ligase TRIP12 [Smittium culicis]|uniref:HECT-type E3 ubiquitin transferase n=1 Tax=Smittium culicis TaxID=133412 RepID=A0A1R1XVX8_9FUNG|nr:E3 ubiquitin-protein ligase TRIP12 [Smittium culicis]
MGRKSKKLVFVDNIQDSELSNSDEDLEYESNIEQQSSSLNISNTWSRRNPHNADLYFLDSIYSQLDEAYSKLKEASLPVDRIPHLRQLAFIFSISTEENLNNYHVIISEIGIELIALISTSTEPEESLLSIRAIANIIEAQPAIQRFFVNNNLTNALCSQLIQLQDIDIAEQALTTLEVISRNFPSQILESGGISASMTFIDFFTVNSQRTVLQIISNSIQAFNSSNFQDMLQLLPLLSKTALLFDQKVIELSWSSIDAIIKKIDSPQSLSNVFSDELIDLALTQLSNYTTSSLRDLILRILGQVSKKSPSLSLSILNRGIIDFLYANSSNPLTPDQIKQFIPDFSINTPSLPDSSSISYLDEIEVLSFVQCFLPPLQWIASLRENDPDSLFSEHPNSCDYIDLINKIENDPKLSFQLSSLLIYISVNSIKSNPPIQTLNISITSFLLAIYLIDPKQVLSILSLYNLHEFAPWLLSQSQSKSDCTQIAALIIGYRLLNYAPDTYKDLYIRQGALHTLKKIAKKPSKNVKPKIILQGLLFIRDNNLDSSSNNKKETTLSKKYESWSKKMASLTLDTYFPSSDSSNLSSASDVIINQLTIAQSEARNHFENITPNSKSIITEQLKVLETHLSENDTLTAHELEYSGWLDLLSIIGSYLPNYTNPDQNSPVSDKAHLALFIYNYLVGVGCDDSNIPSKINLDSLVGILHDSLDINDSLPTFAPPRTLSELNLNPLTYLAKSIKVELECLEFSSIFKNTSSYSDEFKEFITFKVEDSLKNFELSVPSTVITDSLSIFAKPRILQAISKSYSLFQKNSEAPLSQNESFLTSFSKKPTPILFNFESIYSENEISFDDSSHSQDEMSVDASSLLNKPSSDSMDLELRSINKDYENNCNEPSTSSQQNTLSDTSKFNPSDFSIQFYYKDSISNKEFMLNSNDSLFLSLLTSKFDSEKQDYNQFYPWTTTFKLFYKFFFNSPKSEISRSDSRNDDSSASDLPKMSYSLAAKKSLSDKPTQPVTDSISNTTNDSLKIFPKKFRTILSVFSFLYHSRLLLSLNTINSNSYNADYNWELPFLNKKLTSKLEALVNDPYIVSTRGFPFWVAPLSYHCFYLFSFESRYKFMRISFIPINRNLNKWQSSQSSYIVSSPNEHLNNFSRTILGLPIAFRLENGNLGINTPKTLKQKILVNRSQSFDSAFLTLNKFANVDNVLEFQFVDEVGTGLGPTIEMYSIVCNEFLRKDLGIWYSNNNLNSPNSDYILPPNGLFPLPFNSEDENEISKYHDMFSFLGLFVAKSIVDERPIDLPIHPSFFLLLLNSIDSIKFPMISPIKIISHIDPTLANSLNILQSCITKKSEIYSKKNLTQDEKNDEVLKINLDDGSSIDDLGLDFTLPGNPAYLLRPNGADITVNILNLNLYLELVYDAFASTGTKLSTSAFKHGFTKLLPIETLAYHSINELSVIVGFNGSSNEDDTQSSPGDNAGNDNRYKSIDDDAWSSESLSTNIVADHGYSQDSPVFKMFISWLSNLSRTDRRKFLNFVTGSPRLPHTATLSTNYRKMVAAPSTPVANSLPCTPTPAKAENNSEISNSELDNDNQGTPSSNNHRVSSYPTLKKAQISGFGALNPPLTVVLRHCQGSLSPDDYLPTVMTCANYIKLPNYSSIEALNKNWTQAIKEGSHSFHLS